MTKTSLLVFALVKPLLPPTDPASYREVKLADGSTHSSRRSTPTSCRATRWS
jgi:hypothetical protein